MRQIAIGASTSSLNLPRESIYDDDDHHFLCKHCEAQKDGRNLILSFDGTSNQFGDNNTNVIELYHRIVKDDNQLTYYNSGIGTYARPSVASFRYWRQILSNKIDLAIAWDFEKVLLAGYRWLSDTYRPGDRIFLFGFSRGAYQVRALAGMISEVGIILPGNVEQIPFAFELYADRKSKGSGDNRRKRFKETFSRPDVKVHFLGAWDTVSSIGVIRGKSLPMTDKFNDDICYFRHALALDERRVKFLPEYVCGGESYIPPSENPKGNRDYDSVKEVWFSGCHSDIGGGGQSNAKLNNASVPVLWMGNEALIAGLRLYPSRFEWKWDELRNSKPKESLTLAWRFLEFLPVKRLSYTGKAHHTWWPHLGGGRVIKPGQKVHASVAFIHGSKPKATLRKSEAGIEWERILRKGEKDSVVWAHGLQHLLEMDLFDHSNAAIIIGLAKNDIHNTFFIGRLQFMASFHEGAEGIKNANPMELICKMLESNTGWVKDAGALLLCKVAAWVTTGSDAILDDLPKDKAKWIAVENNKLVFNILDPDVTRYGLATSLKLDTSSASHIYDAIRDAAIFYHQFNGTVSKPNSDLENNIQIEFTKLGSSKGGVDGHFDATNMPNLYQNGVVNVVIEKETGSSAFHSFRITNNSPWDLYLGVLYFEHIDFDAHNTTTYDKTPGGQFKLDQLLIANGESQPVGSGSDFWRYHLPHGEELDVQLIKLFFFPESAADVSKSFTHLFFTDSDVEPLGTMLIPVVQRLAK